VQPEQVVRGGCHTVGEQTHELTMLAGAACHVTARCRRAWWAHPVSAKENACDVGESRVAGQVQQAEVEDHVCVPVPGNVATAGCARCGVGERADERKLLTGQPSMSQPAQRGQLNQQPELGQILSSDCGTVAQAAGHGNPPHPASGSKQPLPGANHRHGPVNTKNRTKN
jgi:hypothetical protein